MPVPAMPALTDDILSWALWYADVGFTIFPCHNATTAGCSCLHKATCDSPGKHPRITAWQTRATTDHAMIEKWWGHMFLDANIGLATGRTCWVLDMDPASGGALTLDALTSAHGPLPETPLVHSGGGGFHYYFQLPSTGILGNRVQFAPGLDTRSQDGLIILPPSLHASGRHYAWDADHDLENTPLAAAPAWLLALIQQPQATGQPPRADGAPIPDGTRNQTLSKMAFGIRKAGVSLDGVRAALLTENARCVPPLTPDEIEKIVDGKKDIHPDPLWVFTPPGSNGTHAAPATPPAWTDSTPWEAMYAKQYPVRQWHINKVIPHGLS
jgi:hypothetical protein